MLGGLTAEFSTLKTVLKAGDISQLSVDDLEAQLIQESQDRKQRGSIAGGDDKAFLGAALSRDQRDEGVAGRGRRRGSGRGGSGSSWPPGVRPSAVASTVVSWATSQHIAQKAAVATATAWAVTRHGGGGRGSSGSSGAARTHQPPPPLALAASTFRMRSSDWVLDSGASHHITYDDSLFVSVEAVSGMRSITFGNGLSAEVVSVGTVVLDTGYGAPVSLIGVLYVPESSANLFSLTRAVANGAEISMAGRYCTVNHSGRGSSTRSTGRQRPLHHHQRAVRRRSAAGEASGDGGVVAPPLRPPGPRQPGATCAEEMAAGIGVSADAFPRQARTCASPASSARIDSLLAAQRLTAASGCSSSTWTCAGRCQVPSEGGKR